MHRSVVCLSALILLFCNSSAHSQTQAQVGYAVLEPTQTGSTSGTALISMWSGRGVLLAESGFGAVAPTTHGCFLVSQENGARTSVAMINPSSAATNVVLTLKDSAGLQIAQRNEVFGPGEQHTFYIDQLFPIVQDLYGSLTFQSDNAEGIAALALRWTGNAFGEPTISSTPVIDLNEPAPDPLLFPQVAAGDNLSTAILLLNSTTEREIGALRFLTDAGAPMQLTLNGSSGWQFAYDIPAGGLFRANVTRSGSVVSGFAEVTTIGGAVPSGQTVFQYATDSGLHSEAVMTAGLTTLAARVFVEQSTAHTGVAVANTSAAAATLTLSLRNLDGVFLKGATRGLPAKGHTAFLADEIFPGLPDSFAGLMDIVGTEQMAVGAVRVITSVRNNTILSSLPAVDLMRPPPARKLFLPQMTFGYFGKEFLTSRTILLTQGSNAAGGQLRLLSSGGAPLSQALGCSKNDFAYALSPGGGSIDVQPCVPQHLTVTRSPTGPVLRSGAAGVPMQTLDPFVLEDGEGYHLFFTSIFCRRGNDYSISFDPANPSNCSLLDTIGATAYAFSSDKGFTWNLRDRPVLYPGFTGWDSRKTETPNVVRVGNRLYLFYSADGVGFEQRFQIGATAMDLIGGSVKETLLNSGATFVRPSAPLIPFETTRRAFTNNVQEPSVVFRNGRFEIYFTGVELELPGMPIEAAGQDLRFVGLGRRVFDSQLNVVERNDTPLLDWVNMPEVKLVDDSYFLFSTTLGTGEFHHGEQLVLRTSADGLRWTNPVPLLTKQPAPAFDDWGVAAAGVVPGPNAFTIFYMAFGVQNSACVADSPGGRVGTPIENRQRCVFTSIGRAAANFPN